MHPIMIKQEQLLQNAPDQILELAVVIFLPSKHLFISFPHNKVFKGEACIKMYCDSVLESDY